MKYAKKIAVIILSAMMVVCLSACGSNSSSFTQPSTEALATKNGAVIALNLAQYSENLNSCAQTLNVDMKTIDSLDMWASSLNAPDEVGNTYTYRVVNFENDNATPAFCAAVYDTSGFIRETRVEWTSDEALKDTEVFKNYAMIEIMASTGADENIASMMYDTVKSSSYTNGVSTQLTYACYGNFRCYYMINDNYHLVVVEPYSTQSRTDEESTGNFIYMDVSESGVSASATSNTASVTGATSTSGDSASGDASSSSTGTSDSSGSTTTSSSSGSGSSDSSGSSSSSSTSGSSSSSGTVPVTSTGSTGSGSSGATAAAGSEYDSIS